MNGPVCEDIRRRLSAYLDGELAVEDQRAVVNHLTRCGNCARELEALRRMVNTLGALPEVRPRHDIAGAVLDEIESQSGWAASLRPLFRFRFALAGGMAVILLAAGMWVYQQRQSLFGPEPMRVAKIDEYKVIESFEESELRSKFAGEGTHDEIEPLRKTGRLASDEKSKQAEGKELPGQAMKPATVASSPPEMSELEEGLKSTDDMGENIGTDGSAKEGISEEYNVPEALDSLKAAEPLKETNGAVAHEYRPESINNNLILTPAGSVDGDGVNQPTAPLALAMNSESKEREKELAEGAAGAAAGIPGSTIPATDEARAFGDRVSMGRRVEPNYDIAASTMDLELADGNQPQVTINGVADTGKVAESSAVVNLNKRIGLYYESTEDSGKEDRILARASSMEEKPVARTGGASESFAAKERRFRQDLVIATADPIQSASSVMALLASQGWKNARLVRSVTEAGPLVLDITVPATATVEVLRLARLSIQKEEAPQDYYGPGASGEGGSYLGGTEPQNMNGSALGGASAEESFRKGVDGQFRYATPEERDSDVISSSTTASPAPPADANYAEIPISASGTIAGGTILLGYSSMMGKPVSTDGRVESRSRGYKTTTIRIVFRQVLPEVPSATTNTSIQIKSE